MSELLLLAVVAGLAMFWLDSRAVQQIAVVRCRQACANAGVDLLDDVAPIGRVRLERDAGGVIRLRRVFNFEYGTALGERRSGSIIMLGRKAILLHLDQPQATAPPSERSTH